MSIYDKSSLVLIPSGTKTGKVFSQKPVSGDGDFTFARSSAATRVNADGNIEKETQNLLTQSNTFSNADWLKYLLSLTSGQSGYDGTNDAWLIEKSGAYGNVYRNVSNSGVFTWSVYAKTGSFDFLCLRFRNTSNQYRSAFFDLSTGTLGSVDSNIIKHTIESVGSGWYRCQIAFNDPAINQVMIYPSDVNNGIGNAGTGSIYIQDAQLEQGLVARDVITTTTAAVYGGITDNTPRLDYTDSSCPALLLEPLRTNLVVQSENIGNWWLWSNVTALNNQGISPEGVNNAAKITLTSTGGCVIYRSSVNVGDGVLSFFAKPETLSSGRVRVSVDGVGAAYWNIDGTLNSVTGGTAENGENYGNGWFRFSYNVPSGSVVNYGVQGGVIGETMLVYGMQAEANASYPTSYIPTYGSSVSRVQDLCFITNLKNNVTTGATQGSVMIDFTRDGFHSTGDAIQVYGDTSNGRGYVYNTGVGFASDWGLSAFNISYGTDYKVLYRLNTLSTGNIFLNGSKSYDASGSSWGSINAIYLRGNHGTLKIRQVLVSTTALTDQEAIDLTTI